MPLFAPVKIYCVVRKTYVWVRNQECVNCNQPVNLLDLSAFILQRIDGNSDNGFEPECVACLCKSVSQVMLEQAVDTAGLLVWSELS